MKETRREGEKVLEAGEEKERGFKGRKIKARYLEEAGEQRKYK